MNNTPSFIKEIKDQPKVLPNTLSQYLSPNYALKMTQPPLEDRQIRELRRIFLVGSGSSFYAGLVGENYIENLTDLSASAEPASEFRYRSLTLGPTDLVVAISQSGETSDTLETLKKAQNAGALTLAVVNASPSPMTEAAQSTLLTLAGFERSVVSTKSFTAQLLVLLLLALRLAQSRGLNKNICHEILNEVAFLPEMVRHALAAEEQAAALAQKITGVKQMLYLARGLSSPLALEGAQKMKEIAKIHAEGVFSGEIRHGSLVLLGPHMPVIMLAAEDEHQSLNLNLAKEIKALGSPLYVITENTNRELIALADGHLPVPKTPAFLKPMTSVVPMQLLAYHTANIKGLEVDDALGLTKTVVENI